MEEGTLWNLNRKTQRPRVISQSQDAGRSRVANRHESAPRSSAASIRKMIKFFDFLNFSNFYDLYFFDFRFFQIFSILAFKHSENETNFAANPYTIFNKLHLKKNTLMKMPKTFRDVKTKKVWQCSDRRKLLCQTYFKKICLFFTNFFFCSFQY